MAELKFGQTIINSQELNGALDEVRFYHRALTVSEIQTLATAPATGSAPAITVQPVAQTIEAGQTATFSVTATGSPLTYQWLKNGVAISAATAASYTTPANALADGGAAFSVIVSNHLDAALSSSAGLSAQLRSFAALFTPEEVAAGDTGISDDFDSDGLRIGVEFLTGTDPRASTSASSIQTGTHFEAGAEYLELTYVQDLNVNASGDVQVSGDLQTWLSGVPNTIVLSDQTLGNIRTVAVRDCSPFAGHARRFIRLQVNIPAN
ncbi:MAG: hypothetical protein H7Y36_11760 [Armatimonadetes bacterium]|nr:hypothetical protein [Akkermansiaceae bacterium]